MFGKELSGPVIKWGISLYEKWEALTDKDLVDYAPRPSLEGRDRDERSVGTLAPQLRKLWVLKEKDEAGDKFVLCVLFEHLVRKEFRLGETQTFFISSCWSVVAQSGDG